MLEAAFKMAVVKTEVWPSSSRLVLGCGGLGVASVRILAWPSSILLEEAVLIVVLGLRISVV